MAPPRWLLKLAVALALVALCKSEVVEDACESPGWEGICEACKSRLDCRDDSWADRRCECVGNPALAECTCKLVSVGPAGIAFTVIFLVAVVAGIIACCYCCECCPVYQARHPAPLVASPIFVQQPLVAPIGAPGLGPGAPIGVPAQYAGDAYPPIAGYPQGAPAAGMYVVPGFAAHAQPFGGAPYQLEPGTVAQLPPKTV